MKKFFFLLFTFFSFAQLMSVDLSWSAPTTLSTSMVDASEPQIIMDSAGNTTAVWVESTLVKASNLPTGGSWSSVSTISGAGSSSPRLAVDSSGNVTAVWVDDGVVKTATMSSGGSWGSVTTLSSSGASQPAVALTPGGDAVVVWTRNGFIESKTKLILGLWSLVSVISGDNSDLPDVAVGANGTVIAVWHRVQSGSDVVQSSSQTAIGGVWTSAKMLVQLSTAFGYSYPKVAVDLNGNAAALVYRYQIVNGNYINVSLYGTTLPLNAAAWLAIPVKLSGSGMNNPANLVAKIAFDNVGNAIALWTMSYDDSYFTVETSQKLVGADWSTTQQLVERNLYSFGVDAATNSIGDAVGLYTYFDGSSIIINASEVNISGINADVFWSSPVVVTTDMGNAYPKVASVFLSPDVLAAAAWIGYDGANTRLEVSTASRTVIDPPSNLAVNQNTTDFGVYVDYANTITWDASASPGVVEYEIFRNGVFFARVNAMATLEVVDHNVDPMASTTYGVACIDGDLTQSETVTVTYP